MPNRLTDALAKMHNAEKRSSANVIPELREVYAELAEYLADMPIPQQRELAAAWKKCFELADKYAAQNDPDPLRRAFNKAFDGRIRTPIRFEPIQ